MGLNRQNDGQCFWVGLAGELVFVPKTEWRDQCEMPNFSVQHNPNKRSYPRSR